MYEIAKEGSFLGFKHIDFDNEKNHLQEKSEIDKERTRKQVIEMKKENPAISSREASTKIENCIAHSQY